MDLSDNCLHIYIYFVLNFTKQNKNERKKLMWFMLFYFVVGDVIYTETSSVKIGWLRKQENEKLKSIRALTKICHAICKPNQQIQIKESWCFRRCKAYSLEFYFKNYTGTATWRKHFVTIYSLYCNKPVSQLCAVHSSGLFGGPHVL